MDLGGLSCELESMAAHARRLRLVQLLRGGLQSARVLASRVGCSVRSVHRDIMALRREGFRIAGRVGRTGGFVLEASTPVQVTLEQHEVRVLVAALLDSAVNERLLGRTDPEPLFERLMAQLPPRRRAGMRALFRHVAYRRRVMRGPKPGALLEIEEALLERSALRMVDRSGTQVGIPPTFQGAPQGLVAGPLGWSLRFLPEPSGGRRGIDVSRTALLADVSNAHRVPGSPWWARRTPKTPWTERNRPPWLRRPFAPDDGP